MASIIIDGYNLIGTQHRDLEAARSALIEAVSAYAKSSGHDITLVFDGWKDGGPRETEARQGGIAVVFSPLGERADAIIKRRISAPGGRRWIVVSSDREIISHAWSHDSVPVDSALFLDIIEGNRPVGGDGYPARGRKPSRRDRAIARAIAKL